MSHQLHDFVQEHVVRGTWKRKLRPVLLNSWEAAYFDINERKLLRLAKAAKEAGIELFVMTAGLETGMTIRVPLGTGMSMKRSCRADFWELRRKSKHLDWILVSG